MGTRALRRLFTAKTGPWTLKVPTQASLGAHEAAGPPMLGGSAHSPQAVSLRSRGIEESCTRYFCRITLSPLSICGGAAPGLRGGFYKEGLPFSPIPPTPASLKWPWSLEGDPAGRCREPSARPAGHACPSCLAGTLSTRSCSCPWTRCPRPSPRTPGGPPCLPHKKLGS